MLTTTELVLRFVACLFLLVLIGASVWGAKKRWGVRGLIGGLVLATFLLLLLASAVVEGIYEDLAWQSGHYNRQIQDFAGALRTFDAEGLWFVRAGVSKPAAVMITVTDGWHPEHYQVRLQRVQNLYRAWRDILYSSNTRRRARVVLVDGNGNTIGGSHW
jgi:hypothetical protein